MRHLSRRLLVSVFILGIAFCGQSARAAQNCPIMQDLSSIVYSPDLLFDVTSDPSPAALERLRDQMRRLDLGEMQAQMAAAGQEEKIPALRRFFSDVVTFASMGLSSGPQRAREFGAKDSFQKNLRMMRQVLQVMCGGKPEAAPPRSNAGDEGLETELGGYQRLRDDSPPQAGTARKVASVFGVWLALIFSLVALQILLLMGFALYRQNHTAMVPARFRIGTFEAPGHLITLGREGAVFRLDTDQAGDTLLPAAKGLICTIIAGDARIDGRIARIGRNAVGAYFEDTLSMARLKGLLVDSEEKPKLTVLQGAWIGWRPKQDDPVMQIG